MFFPAHDLSLAAGVKPYTPPAIAIRLQADLAVLSSWWQPIPAAPIPVPWGWNYETRRMLSQSGVSEDFLPSQEALATLRELSHRQTTIFIIQSLKDSASAKALPDFSPVAVPRLLSSPAALEAAVASASAPFLLKAPWSSSGRGLCWSRTTAPDVLLRRGRAVIRSMGGVMMEPEYTKVQDFAILFFVGQEAVRFVGYSLFDTDAAGVYRSGAMMSNEAIEQRLSPWIPAAALQRLARCFSSDLLPVLFHPLMRLTWPLGYVGVDMMICRAVDGGIFLHPAVEMNVRCTMGVVARCIHDRAVHPASTGRFVIAHAPSAALLAAQQEALARAHPAVVADGRWRAGFFPLTPLGPSSRFAAYLLLDAQG